MRILIIGGTSSLGSTLKKAFSEFGEVITAGRKGCDITMDLSHPLENISMPNNIDVVIHTAAHFGGKTANEILEAENINALGTLKVCQASVQAGAKMFVFISSMYVCLKNTSEYYSIYALSKRHAEEVAQFYCKIHSLPLAILRPTQMYANGGGSRKHQPFFYTIVDKAESGEDITIYGSNDALRNYIHIDDLTNIIIRVAQNKVEGIYSCAYTTDVTLSQIAKAAISAFHSKSTIKFLKDREDIPDNIFEKDNSLYNKIKYYPQVSIEDGMKKIALHRDRQS